MTKMATDVAWYGRSGWEGRSWALYGISKRHLTDDGHTTLCGRVFCKSKTIDPRGLDQCQHCKRVACPERQLVEEEIMRTKHPKLVAALSEETPDAS